MSYASPAPIELIGSAMRLSSPPAMNVCIMESSFSKMTGLGSIIWMVKNDVVTCLQSKN